jgi:hypothetical protein
MGALPPEIVRVLRVFEDGFSERVWDWVQVLIIGAMLTPSQRTVAAVLRVMGLSDERQFQNYHRVLQPGTLVESGAEAAPALGAGRDVCVGR